MAKTTITKAATVKTPVATEEKTKVDATTTTVKETKPQPHNYESSDLIKCRSVTQGTLVMGGKKSKILYKWAGYGDICEVEYGDLLSEKTSGSKYLTAPLFIVEDEELINSSRWKDLKDVYENIYDYSDINNILKLPIARFREELTKAPTAFKRAVAIEVTSRVENETFDSIQKIKAVEEICNVAIEIK